MCLGAAHTHPSGVSAELTALSTVCVCGSLCFLSLSLGLMNRAVAAVGLSVTALLQWEKRQEEDKE